MQMAAIETFLQIIEHGGFHAAARQLNLPQTTVSARIRTLEDALSNKLFERGASGSTLTRFGEEFRPFAQEMASLWKIAATELPDRMTSRLSLRVGAQLSIWDPLLVDLAIALEQGFGKLVFALNFDHTLDVGEAVGNHILDLALSHEKSGDPRVSHQQLAPELLLPVATPPASGRAEDQLFINLDLGEHYRNAVQQRIPQQTGQNLFLGNCLMALRYMLKRGGQGLFPRYLVDPHVEEGRLILLPQSEPLSLPCYLISRKDSPSREQHQQVASCLSDLRSASE